MGETQFLLYLKALIWSVFVSYSGETIERIAEAVRTGVINEELKEFKDTHLGKGLRYLLSEIAEPNDRLRLSDSLREIKQSMPSLVYQNKIIEVGHYVVAAQNLEGIPENCYGVVFRLEPAKIHVLFRISGKRLVPAVVRPFEIMPVYTLVVPESKL